MKNYQEKKRMRDAEDEFRTEKPADSKGIAVKKANIVNKEYALYRI
jgi:hypothetical protein